jgi:hypothetical protein
VILVPKPKLDVVGKCGGSIISWQGDSLAIDDLVSSKLEQKADPLFRMLLSDESNYKTQKAEINWYDDKGNTCFRSEVLDNTISPKLSTEGLSRAKYIISKIEGTRLSNGKEEFAFFPKYIRQVKCLNIPPEKIDSIRCPVNFSCGLYNEK